MNSSSISLASSLWTATSLVSSLPESAMASPKVGPLTKAMRARLRRGGHRSRYRLRKQTVEPVFGQIKHARGFRQFLLRGLEKVRGEWSLLAIAHNLLKLAKAAPQTA